MSKMSIHGYIENDGLFSHIIMKNRLIGLFFVVFFLSFNSSKDLYSRSKFIVFDYYAFL